MPATSAKASIPPRIINGNSFLKMKASISNTEGSNDHQPLMPISCALLKPKQIVSTKAIKAVIIDAHFKSLKR